ncbi:hypothetical protein ACVKSY_002786 [Sphingomonas sp. PvP107]
MQPWRGRRTVCEGEGKTWGNGATSLNAFQDTGWRSRCVI